MANNVINAVFSSSNITYTKPAYQYDYGMILRFSGIELPQAYEVHFSNTEFCGESISQIGDETGVTIPDEMFLSGAPIYAWTFLHTGEDDGETVYKTVISINKRAQPSDIEPTPVQQDVITQAIAALNTAVEQTAQDVIDATAAKDAAETAQGLAESARDAAETAQGKAEGAQEAAENAQEAAETAQGKAEDAQEAAEQAAGAVLGLTADASVDANTGTPSVEVNVSTVSDHKNMSFSFHNLKGDPGEPGEPGDDGFSPVVSVSSITGGHEVAVTDKNGTQTFDVMDGTDGEDGVSPTVTVTEISGGHEVTVTDAEGTQTFDVLDGEITEDALEERLIDKADVITSSASGEIVMIADGGNNLPVVDLSVSLLPVQDLHGQDAPYPAGGGKNLYGKNISISGDYIRFPSANSASSTYLDRGVQMTANTTYTITITVPNSVGWTIYGAWLSARTQITLVSKATNKSKSFTVTPSQDDTLGFWAYCSDGWGTATADQVTCQVELGSSATPYAPYSNICPISGWTGVEVYHSDADTSNPTTYPIDWTSTAGTVYGGSLDLTTGVLTVTHDYYRLLSSWNWTKSANYSNAYYCSMTTEVDHVPLQSNILKTVTTLSDYASTEWSIYHDYNVNIHADSNYDTVAKFKEWLSDNEVYIVRPLKTVQTYQLDPVQIQTLLGINNFWSNGNGQIDLEYRADTKLYIENLTKPSEDDMTANQNITSGSFFMVGNRLFLSSVAIAQGSTIIPGTNCTEISLADALNQINA